MTNTLSIRSLDIPTIHKFGIGFDSMINELLRLNSQHTNYPPFNVIRKDEDKFTIEVAVAGFKQGEVSVQTERNNLIITGSRKNEDEEEIDYLHRGISSRSFSRSFPLGTNVEVTNAAIQNGILTIELERIIPEDQKAKTIDISYIK
jgi:molecular chaperone IbpA